MAQSFILTGVGGLLFQERDPQEKDALGYLDKNRLTRGGAQKILSVV